MSIFTSIGWVLLIKSQDAAYWTLVIAPDVTHRDIAYCNRDRDVRSLELMAGNAVLAVGEIAMLCGLTYLFLKALWNLRVSILHLHEQSSQRNEPIGELQQNRLDRLDKVMKKQCILVGFCSFCTFIVWACAVYSFNASTWVCWDIIIHCICVWMMTKNAISYWNCCKKYGFCCCCYWQKYEYNGNKIVSMAEIQIDLHNKKQERKKKKKRSRKPKNMGTRQQRVRTHSHDPRQETDSNSSPVNNYGHNSGHRNVIESYHQHIGSDIRAQMEKNARLGNVDLQHVGDDSPLTPNIDIDDSEESHSNESGNVLYAA